jgi:hypothetical protein
MRPTKLLNLLATNAKRGSFRPRATPSTSTT